MPNAIDTLLFWGRSSVGRVLDWQSRGRGFEPHRLHHIKLIDPRSVDTEPVLYVSKVCFFDHVMLKIHVCSKSMSTYIPDLWIKHPENKDQIEKLVREYDATNYTDILQSTEDGLERQAKTTIIIRKLYEIGEMEIAAILGPGLLFEKGRA